MGDNRLENVRQLVAIQKPAFEQIARIHGAVNFIEEASFAMQSLQNNDYLCKTAMASQDSFKRAILNVAIIGLSLNPYKHEAYLVPRKGKICLDISYIGYVNMFLNLKAIQWCVSEIHCVNDTLWTWKGFSERPIHEFDPSVERGRILGCYVCAKLYNGDIISTYMNIKDIYRIRDTYSESWKGTNKNYSPWFTNETEMIKKTVIRYARKSWPYVDQTKRIEKMDTVVQETEPISLNAGISESEVSERRDLINKIRKALVAIGEDESVRIIVCARAYGNPDLKDFQELTTMELKHALKMINQEVDEGKK